MPMGVWNSWVTKKKRWCVRAYTENPFVHIMYIHYAHEPQTGWACIGGERLFGTLYLDLDSYRQGLTGCSTPGRLLVISVCYSSGLNV